MVSAPEIPTAQRASELFASLFGDGDPLRLVSVPGRVNLIGEHIDYHDLPVLPMAIQRRVSLVFRARPDSLIRAASDGYGVRDLSLVPDPAAFPPGDWGNYLAAAVHMAAIRWPLQRGIDAAIASDLPSAAGLSSSSALLTAFALALLSANEIEPSIPELMEVLPEGEQYVGTRGGGMDHAAVLASQAGSALLIGFNPLELQSIPIPPGWCFLIAHSLTTAEKSGAIKAEYNARRTAGTRALQQLGFSSFRAALQAHSPAELAGRASTLSGAERDAFLHVTSEAARVTGALDALRRDDKERFGARLTASHRSLRDHLKVSNPSLDELVESALESGALGARVTGAGFGGCALILCEVDNRASIESGIIGRFYRHRNGFVPSKHIIAAQPSFGALSA